MNHIFTIIIYFLSFSKISHEHFTVHKKNSNTHNFFQLKSLELNAQYGHQM
jgi:hypothetical protein